MSYKMDSALYWKELDDLEHEINNGFWWKFKSKKNKKLLLARIAFQKSIISTANKTLDCLRQTAENI